MKIAIKRVYEEPSAADGTRILVDHLWPRGLSKEAAAVSLWLKDIAPSTELREWFGHDPAKWAEFKKRYTAELRQNHEAMAALSRYAKTEKVTLVYAARDEQHNNALVLLEYLQNN